MKETKAQRVRRLVNEAVRGGNIMHDSNGKLYFHRESNSSWQRFKTYSERIFIRLLTQNIGEDELTHVDIEFLRQELAEEPILLARELDYP